MSVSTNGRWKRGEIVYVATSKVGDIRAIFEARNRRRQPQRQDRVTEGYASPGKVADFLSAARLAQSSSAPATTRSMTVLHDDLGSPDLDSWDRKPTIAVVSVNQTEVRGCANWRKRAVSKRGSPTKLDEGWVECLVRAEIKGNQAPDGSCSFTGTSTVARRVGDNSTATQRCSRSPASSGTPRQAGAIGPGSRGGRAFAGR